MHPFLVERGDGFKLALRLGAPALDQFVGKGCAIACIDTGKQLLGLAVGQPDAPAGIQHQHGFLHAVEHDFVQCGQPGQCAAVHPYRITCRGQVGGGKRGEQRYDVAGGNQQDLCGEQRQVAAHFDDVERIKVQEYVAHYPQCGIAAVQQRPAAVAEQAGGGQKGQH